jgi:hypothetical protein
MKRLSFVFAATLLIPLASQAALPAAAQAAQSDAVCTLRATDTITPGLSLTPSAGSVGSGGETGSITCLGAINGRQVTGQGTWGVAHSYGPGPLGPATCLQSSGTGTYFYTVPTAGGPLHVVGSLSYTALGLVGTFAGKADTSSMSGVFQFVPIKGDCITTPVTAIAIMGQFVQHG